MEVIGPDRWEALSPMLRKIGSAEFEPNGPFFDPILQSLSVDLKLKIYRARAIHGIDKVEVYELRRRQSAEPRFVVARTVDGRRFALSPGLVGLLHQDLLRQITMHRKRWCMVRPLPLMLFLCGAIMLLGAIILKHDPVLAVICYSLGVGLVAAFGGTLYGEIERAQRLQVLLQKEGYLH